MKEWFDAVEDTSAAEQHLVTDKDWLGGLGGDAFASGEKISSWPSGAWLKCSDRNADGSPDDVLRNHLGLPVFSASLRGELEARRLGTVQYLPVEVLRFNDRPVGTYFIANILTVVPALDLSHSDLTLYPSDYFIYKKRGSIFSVRKYVLNGTRIRNFDIMRPAEYPIPYFVSDRFVALFKAGSFSGLEFRKVEVTG